MKYVIVWVGLSGFSMSMGNVILKHAHALPTLSSIEQATYALHAAVKIHNVEAARVALLLGADSNVPDRITGRTPLMEAITSDDTAMIQMLHAYTDAR